MTVAFDLSRAGQVAVVRARLVTLLDAIEAARTARIAWEAIEGPHGEPEWEALDALHKLEEEMIRLASDPEQLRFLRAVADQLVQIEGDLA